MKKTQLATIHAGQCYYYAYAFCDECLLDLPFHLKTAIFVKTFIVSINTRKIVKNRIVYNFAARYERTSYVLLLIDVVLH